MQAEQNEKLEEINTTLFPLKPTQSHSLDDIPDHLIQNEIFSYLTSNDLFFNGRAVSTNWNEMVKNVWSNKIKEEMIEQVKSIDFIYEKEVLTKTYEFKLSYLINYKNLLTAYNNNANILTIIYHLVQHLGDAEVKNLIALFFSFINLQFAFEYVQENQTETLKNYLINEDNYIYFKIKILELMIIEENLKDMNYLDEMKAKFALLNKDYLENISDFAKLIYSFLQGMIEYQILKVEVKELKEKIENLLKKLQETSKIWPKKKRFLEKAYKLIIFNKNSTPKIRKIISKFEQCKIRHPLIDYNDECIRSILEVRKFLLTNQSKMQEPILNGEGNVENPIDEKIFENISQRRILLTKKMLILERFSDLYGQCVNKDNDAEFLVKGNVLTLKEFLWSMKISANSQEENVTEESLLRTKLNLDKNFDYENHIIYTIPRRMQKDNLEYERKQKEESFKNKDANRTGINELDFNNDENEDDDNKYNCDKEDKEIFDSLANELDKYEFLLKLSKNYTDGNKQEDEDNECKKIYCENCINRIKCNENLSVGGETNGNDIDTNLNHGGHNSGGLRIDSMPFVPIRPCSDNNYLINESNNSCNLNCHKQNKRINKNEIKELEDYNNEKNEEEEEEEVEMKHEKNKNFFNNFRKQGILSQENEAREAENSSNNTNKNSDLHDRPPAYGYNIRAPNTINSENNNLISINPIQSNNHNNNNSNNFNYRDPELEEEVKQAESIVDQLHVTSGRRPNSDELISVLESKEAEVNRLRIEKDRLVLRKQKTEQVLDMLKKFLVLKDNMSKNKRYYKVISYLLARVRSNQNHHYAQTNDIANLSQLINSGELEQIISNENFDSFFDSNTETQEEVENFRQLDELIKEIEVGLLKQVNEIFGEHASENTNNGDDLSN